MWGKLFSKEWGGLITEFYNFFIEFLNQLSKVGKLVLRY